LFLSLRDDVASAGNFALIPIENRNRNAHRAVIALMPFV